MYLMMSKKISTALSGTVSELGPWSWFKGRCQMSIMPVALEEIWMAELAKPAIG